MARPQHPVRGRVYGAVIDESLGEKYYLVVSNNQRNRHLADVLAVRLTTSRKPEIDSIVECGQEDPFAGRILCDDIVGIYKDEITRDLGAISSKTMRQVEEGLRVALAL